MIELTRRKLTAFVGASMAVPGTGFARSEDYDQLRAVATRVRVAGALVVDRDHAWSVTRIHHVACDSVDRLSCVFANWGVALPGGDVAGPNAIRLRASIEARDGTILPLSFAGAHDVVVPSGGTATADALRFSFAAGDVFCTRTAVSGSYGRGSWPANMDVSGGYPIDGICSAPAGTHLTLGGTITDAGRTEPAFGPVAVMGTPERRRAVVAIVGDSIAFGAGDYTGDRMKNSGFIERGLNNRFGFVNVARSGEEAVDFVSGSRLRRRLVRLAGCSHAIVNYGTNDIAAGRSIEQVKSSLSAVWHVLASSGIAKIFHTTLLPRRYSGAIRQDTRFEVNDWLRQIPKPLAGVIDAAGIVEHDGRWRTLSGFTLTEDGIHPNPTGADLLATSVARITTMPIWAG